LKGIKYKTGHTWKTPKTALHISIVRAVGQARAHAVPSANVKEEVVAARIAAIRAVTAACSDGFVRIEVGGGISV